MTANFMSAHLDAVALDHRIGEEFVGDFGGKRFGLRCLGGGQVQLEVFPLTYVLDAVVAERVQRLRNRAPLRIKYRWFQRDEDSGSHGRVTFCKEPQCRARGAPSVSTGSAAPPLAVPGAAENTRSKIWST